MIVRLRFDLINTALTVAAIILGHHFGLTWGASIGVCLLASVNITYRK